MSAANEEYPRRTGSAFVQIRRRDGHGKPYRVVKGSDWPMTTFHAQQAATAAKIERELNGGLLAHEAEVVYPRIGKHGRSIFKVHVISGGGHVNI